MIKRIRVIIGLISCLVICIWGGYRLITGYPQSSSLFIPLLFIVGGFIGFISNMIELKKNNVS
ncbi:hypothetical protein [Peribacillus sp. NPDC097295]|uniref:hypothetical protein n=1 Tax=Peribacillus sp. NPDC097295 TaxID=3364402 RepID=UPI00381DC83F